MNHIAATIVTAISLIDLVFDSRVQYLPNFKYLAALIAELLELRLSEFGELSMLKVLLLIDLVLAFE